MIEEIERSDAEMQVPIAPKAKALFGGQVAVEVGGSLRVGEDVLAVCSDRSQTKAASINVLVRAETCSWIALQRRLQADVGRSQQHLAVDGYCPARLGDESAEIKVWTGADPRLHVAAALNAGDARDEPIIYNPSEYSALYVLTHCVRVGRIENMRVIEIHRTVVTADTERIDRAGPIEVGRGTEHAQRLRPCVVESVVQPSAGFLPYRLQSVVVGISVMTRNYD